MIFFSPVSAGLFSYYEDFRTEERDDKNTVDAAEEFIRIMSTQKKSS